MARPKSPPQYRLHKPSGLARVIVDGKHVYLGKYGSEESHTAYSRILAEFLSQGASAPQEPAAAVETLDVSINELLVLYLQHARAYYSKDGSPTQEYVAMRDAVIPLRTFFSHLPAKDFGPLRLKKIQRTLVEEGRKCRTEINKQVKRIRRVFSWAVSEELVPPSVHAALTKVEGLKRGRTEAREAPKVKPVDDVVVEETLKFTTPIVAAMVRIQRLSGARPGEVTIMRPCDIDMTGEVWLYRPTDHKNAWREQPRIIALGPKSQEVLKPFMDRTEDAYLFSPNESEAWRNEQRAIHRSPDRKTPIFPCELKARERRKKRSKIRKRKRMLLDRYTVDSYRRAVTYAIKKANEARSKMEPAVEPLASWHPYQLRHTAATELRKQFGIEAVPLGLGNSPDLAELYAERDLNLLKKIAKEAG